MSRVVVRAKGERTVFMGALLIIRPKCLRPDYLLSSQREQIPALVHCRLERIEQG